jgi:hypothetical protein
MKIAEVVATRWAQRTHTFPIRHLCKTLDHQMTMTNLGNGAIAYDFSDGSRFETKGKGRAHRTFWASQFDPKTQGPLSEGSGYVVEPDPNHDGAHLPIEVKHD